MGNQGMNCCDNSSPDKDIKASKSNYKNSKTPAYKEEEDYNDDIKVAKATKIDHQSLYDSNQNEEVVTKTPKIDNDGMTNPNGQTIETSRKQDKYSEDDIRKIIAEFTTDKLRDTTNSAPLFDKNDYYQYEIEDEEINDIFRNENLIDDNFFY